ncbi:hypothetical protein D9619_003616 [Psilocybe cf. subviscida]|uniref:Zn(2)-C6 fungal-type domain-containing protein n=1 Tax=Psilocybe cf. subviscida TaxID=2480587 RepID=A0A8H5EUF0_9AGAR|nr:hypothetical protein D9619_003616 [Psilocybe cf. subviscida]
MYNISPNPGSSSMQTTFSVGETDSEREESQKGRKRPKRTVNACIRCKARKQRCDLQDQETGPCRSCQKGNVLCILAEKIKKSAYPDDYVRSLETRVADLESHLRTLEPSGGFGNDHWDQPSPPINPRLASRNIESSTYSSMGHSTGWDSTTDDGDDEEGQVARGIALLSLNSAAEPHYIGASSGWSWAKTVMGTINGRHRVPASAVPGISNPNSLRFRNLSGFTHKGRVSTAADSPRVPTDAMAEVLIRTVHDHIQARYPFQCWRSFNKWHVERDKYLVEDLTEPEDRTAAFFIWLMYATGARLLQSSPLPGLPPPEVYYAKAMEYLDTIVTLHNLANIQAFLLLAVYSLRRTEGPSVWHLVGIALRLSVELGLHRKAGHQAWLRDPYTVELRRRIFWSVYGLDRFIALTMGRPLGIQDADIDVEVPMDIDFEEVNDTTLLSLSKQHTAASVASSPVDHCRQIESDIQRLIYRVDRPKPTAVVMEEAMKLLGRLDRWKANIPRKPSDNSSPPCCTPEWFSWRYFEVSLYLLRPLTVSSPPTDPLLSRCAYAAAGSLEAQRRLHQTPPVSLSLSALHSIFLSGLTLLHCLHVNQRILSLIAASKAIRACSNTLFLYAHHFAAAEPFRDAFEDVANACLDAADETAAGAGIGWGVGAPNGASVSPPLWRGRAMAWCPGRDSFFALVSSLGFSASTKEAPLDLSSAPLLARHEQHFLAPATQTNRAYPPTAGVDPAWSEPSWFQSASSTLL